LFLYILPDALIMFLISKVKTANGNGPPNAAKIGKFYNNHKPRTSVR
jgi:hypothetical protein